MKESLSSRLKNKMLNSEKVQAAFSEGWRIHSRMFREIMEPAFTDNMEARLELVAALNLITRNDFVKALRKLKGLEKHCKCNEDDAARLFFMGVTCERSGNRDGAIMFFTQAAALQPQFYMLYTMLGKLLHEINDFDAALANYSMALQCVENKEPVDEVPAVSEKGLMASIYGNIGNACLMMGRYDEAEWAFYESEQYVTDQPQMMVFWAMLYAVTDRKQMAKEKLAKLREKDPEFESRWALFMAELMAGKNPRFDVQTKAVEEADYDGFWQWFSMANEVLLNQLKNNITPFAISEIYEHLSKVFSFMQGPVEFDIEPDGDKFKLCFRDNYIASLTVGLEKLCETAPEELKNNWSFSVYH